MNWRDMVAMDKQQVFSALGLGIGPKNWRKLCRVIEKRLTRDELIFSFELLPLSTDENFGNLGGILERNIPHAVFLSLQDIEEPAVVWRMIREACKTKRVDVPRLFVLEKNPRKTIETRFIDYPVVGFNFLEFGELIIRDSKLIHVRDNIQPVRHEINPTPNITGYEERNPFLDQEGQVAFYYLDRISKMNWKNNDISVNSLVEEVTGQSEKKSLAGILIYKNRAFLTNGFHLPQLKSINLGELKIEHLIGVNQIGSGTVNFELFLRRVNETINQIRCIEKSRDAEASSEYVKRNSPVAIRSDFPVIAAMFKQVLLSESFTKIDLVEENSDPGERFVLSLDGDSEQQDTNWSIGLSLDSGIFNIPGFPQVQGELANRAVSSEEHFKVSRIQNERKQIVRKIEDLDGQIKNLSSSKALADQEKYMNLLASRKLEIFSVLLELASVWDEIGKDSVNTYEENVLIFFEDQIEAEYLNKRVRGEGKRLFLDILENFSDLRSFITINTDLYEPFLHEGVIICSPAGKKSLQDRLDDFQASLENKQYPDVASGLNQYTTQKQQCQARLIELAHQEAICELRGAYYSCEDRIIQAIRQKIEVLRNNRFSGDGVSEICFLASSERVASEIKKGFSSVYKLDGGIRVHTVNERLCMDENSTNSAVSPGESDQYQESGTEPIENVSLQQFSEFMNNILRQLREMSPDLLIIEHNLHVIHSIVKILRNKQGSYQSIPIVAFFSGEFDEDVIESLTLSGVKAFYVDRWNINDFSPYQAGFSRLYELDGVV